MDCEFQEGVLKEVEEFGSDVGGLPIGYCDPVGCPIPCTPEVMLRYFPEQGGFLPMVEGCYCNWDAVRVATAAAATIAALRAAAHAAAQELIIAEVGAEQASLFATLLAAIKAFLENLPWWVGWLAVAAIVALIVINFPAAIPFIPRLLPLLA